MQLLWVSLGGALGSGARYLVSLLFQRSLANAFPVATLVVNLAGCFLLGLLMQVVIAADLPRPPLRGALAAGVLGGFTTYSTFSYESVRLVQTGQGALAALYVGLTLAGGFAGCLAGFALGRWTLAR